ncbi:unnamed protein product, partial [Rotaria sordida]
MLHFYTKTEQTAARVDQNFLDADEECEQAAINEQYR